MNPYDREDEQPQPLGRVDWYRAAVYLGCFAFCLAVWGLAIWGLIAWLG